MAAFGPRGLAGIAVVVLAMLFITYRNYPALWLVVFPVNWRCTSSERAFRAGDYALQNAKHAPHWKPILASWMLMCRLPWRSRRRDSAAEGLEVLEEGASRRTDLVRGELMRVLGEQR